MRKYVTFACLSIACICGVFFFSQPVYAAGTADAAAVYTNTITVNDTVSCGIYLTTMQPDYESYFNGSGGDVRTFNYVVQGSILLRNTSNQDYKFNANYFRVYILPNNSSSSSNDFRLISYSFEPGSLSIRAVNTSGRFTFCGNSVTSHNEFLIVPAYGSIEVYFTLEYQTNRLADGYPTFSSSGVYWDYPSLPASGSYGSFTFDNFSYIPKIFEALKELIGIESSNQELSDDSASTSSTAESVHNQEQSWYTQNEAAINETGLSSYSLDGRQSFAMSTVKSQFTTFWNALGPIKNTYVLVLTISLATHILRHSPRRRASSSGSSSNSGGGGKS